MPIPLPISPADALAKIIDPTSALLPGVPWDDRVAVAILAIGLQEGGKDGQIAYRQQISGPARGPWMFEQGGGVHGVMTHQATAKLAGQLLARRGVPKTERSAYLALAGDDLLACGFARLLLYSDPAPLPNLGYAEGMWNYYLRNWRPGAYTRGNAATRTILAGKFMHNYDIAVSAVQREAAA
ncbi:MAG: hypothetical protein GAK28_00613 [Luteibacter sp.]|uniref:hypothetical protein n=1 Tax=Luteibacter sp. TaxID=1886636 RepID=UPI00137F1959|nr:hypothetical protein [Luteibacter sp.]KAF1008981.1 MAG: hypothetical protein GAK28_00613 [Luteibacter sp.]